MVVIGETANGWMIEATDAEVVAIMNAVRGTNTTNVAKIGVNIPAVDYVTVIHKVKYLKESGIVKELNTRAGQFTKGLDTLNKAIESAYKL